MVLLLEGTLEVLHEGNDGHEVLIRRLERGAIVGDIATVDRGSRSATVRAQSDCLIRRIGAQEFLEKLDQEPRLYKQLFWEQIARVRTLTTDMAASQREAITDPLTKLYNIRFFRQRLSLELDRASQISDPVSIAMFDVDHFKHYNDTNGHQGGDEVLVRIAELFREVGRRGDIVARYGGEEFIVLLYGTTTDEACVYAEDVRQVIEIADFPGGRTQPLGCVTVSGGIATFPQDGTDVQTLIGSADRNLYQAKNRGRNRVCFE